MTSSLLRVVSAVCFRLLYPLSHPGRYVAVDQVESFQRAGLSATSPSARRPRQGDAAQRGSASPAPARPQPPPALEAEDCVIPKRQLGTPVLAPPPSLGHPATSQQQAQALIALLSFLSLLFKNKTNQKKRQKKILNCFSPKSLRVPVSERRAPGRHVPVGARRAQRPGLRGHVRGLASRCLDVCFFSVS